MLIRITKKCLKCDGAGIIKIDSISKWCSKCHGIGTIIKFKLVDKNGDKIHTNSL